MRGYVRICLILEIIMIIEDQDFLIRSMLLLIKIGSRQSAEPATDNDQIVDLRQYGGWPPVRTSDPRAAMCVIV